MVEVVSAPCNKRDRTSICINEELLDGVPVRSNEDLLCYARRYPALGSHFKSNVAALRRHDYMYQTGWHNPTSTFSISCRLRQDGAPRRREVVVRRWHAARARSRRTTASAPAAPRRRRESACAVQAGGCASGHPARGPSRPVRHDQRRSDRSDHCDGSDAARGALSSIGEAASALLGESSCRISAQPRAALAREVCCAAQHIAYSESRAQHATLSGV